MQCNNPFFPDPIWWKNILTKVCKRIKAKLAKKVVQSITISNVLGKMTTYFYLYYDLFSLQGHIGQECFFNNQAVDVGLLATRGLFFYRDFMSGRKMTSLICNDSTMHSIINELIMSKTSPFNIQFVCKNLITG